MVVASGERLRVAVDIGGTFTDLVASTASGNRVIYSKSLTTYDSLSNGVFNCLRLAEIDLAEVEFFFHGSTIAINTVIQRRGAKTGLVTTAGFGDVYKIGRGNRPDAYNLLFEKAVPLVPRDLVEEALERIDAHGNVRRPIDLDALEEGIHRLRSKGVEAIAVVLLHAYRNPEHEKAVGDLLAKNHPEIYVSLSHEILREFREYERTSTTVLNAYVGPVVTSYVRELHGRLNAAGFAGSFLLMQSNGGTMSAEVAATRPVTMMESGPVAGVVGSGALGAALGLDDVIAFDMGGTTAKASLIEKGVARFVTGYFIGGSQVGHPMMLPVVDIVEVGAGGGSIAWIDAGGGLKVGPISAGSTPGPVCYGKGGKEPTITDANLVLGRLDPENFLGGQMRLDLEAARRAIESRIARPLHMSIEEAALGIVKIADTKMSLAVREVSVQKGHDPRGFALVASGGAGPLHAVSIARELSLPRVVVPELPGTFSALGMLATDLRHDYVRTRIADMAATHPSALQSVFDEMAEEGARMLERDGAPRESVRLARSIDLRYVGQEYTLNVPLADEPIDSGLLQTVRSDFDSLHYAQYSHSAPGERVEIVNLRLAAIGTIFDGAKTFARPDRTGTPSSGKPKGERRVYFEAGAFDCAVWNRDDMIPGEVVLGPAVVEERVSTTIIHPGDSARLLAEGPILIETKVG